jgi:hypothetical protein
MSHITHPSLYHRLYRSIQSVISWKKYDMIGPFLLILKRLRFFIKVNFLKGMNRNLLFIFVVKGFLYDRNLVILSEIAELSFLTFAEKFPCIGGSLVQYINILNQYTINEGYQSVLKQLVDELTATFVLLKKASEENLESLVAVD